MALPFSGRCHLMEWRSQLLGVPSNWERPVTGNAIPLNGNAQ
jgi:hypothetical protein